jgi:hypothetical protein
MSQYLECTAAQILFSQAGLCMDDNYLDLPNAYGVSGS